LFLDLDGTLLDFAGRPQDAAPSARLRALLPQLAPSLGDAVAIVSGRAIAELDRLLAPHRFAAAGIHGLERRAPADGDIAVSGNASALDSAREALARLAERHDGLLVEDKRFAIALHFRRRPELEPEVEEAVSALERALPPPLEILRGKMVVEIKLGGSDKGRAIRAFMQEAPFAGRTPVFLGDDVTDEAGFEIVNALGGVSIKVGPGTSIARWRLDGVAAVLAWLEAAMIRNQSTSRSAT
jgi:trehalose 6-phosphate phosphatase